MSKPVFELIEVGGFMSAATGMRAPTKSYNLGDSFSDDNGFKLGHKDKILARQLIDKGPVHAKFQRGMIAWFMINMPRCIWSELDTYTVGVQMISSESTMYTLIKECKNITNDMFVDGTPDFIIKQFKQNIDTLTVDYGDRKSIPIDVLKYCLPESWMQKRFRGFSYQCLASMYRDRRDHRMPEWRNVICPTIEKLPYFNELISLENNNVDIK